MGDRPIAKRLLTVGLPNLKTLDSGHSLAFVSATWGSSYLSLLQYGSSSFAKVSCLIVFALVVTVLVRTVYCRIIVPRVAQRYFLVVNNFIRCNFNNSVTEK